MPETKVTVTESTVKDRDGEDREIIQYRTSVPKSIAEAMDLGGATLKWHIKGGDSIRLEVAERNEDE